MNVLVYDGECGFCAWCVEQMRRRLAVVPDAIAWQRADLGALGLTQAQARARVYLVTAGGTRRSWVPRRAIARCWTHDGGHRAVGEILLRQPTFGLRLIGAVLVTPPFSAVAAVGYALVARARHRLPLPGAAGLPCRVSPAAPACST